MNGPRRPGGYAKLYQDESISIRWYSDTESITISGKDEKEFKEKLTKLASISAGLANGEGKLVDVVDKNRSVSHNDNKSHPNNDLGDSQETCLKNLNFQLQAKLQALSDQFVSSMTYINIGRYQITLTSLKETLLTRKVNFLHLKRKITF